jgi:hypothetical protein
VLTAHHFIFFLPWLVLVLGSVKFLGMVVGMVVVVGMHMGLGHGQFIRVQYGATEDTHTRFSSPILVCLCA